MFKKFNKRKISRNNYLDKKTKINSELDIKNTNETKILEPKKSNFLLILTIFLFFILILIWIFTYKDYSNFKTDILVTEEVIIEIKEWELPLDISSKLWINKRYLKIYLKNNNPDYELLAWDFLISENANIKQILLDLQTPIIEDEIDITILEWWNIYDIDEYLTNMKLINKQEYIDYVTNLEKIEKLTEFFPFIEWLETLEWYLYPDTYKVLSNNFKINVFVIKQLENFENKVYKEILTEYDNETVEDVINLASIVEKEEKVLSAKATVAWILKKRLNAGWMIWADITVCYPYKLTAEECKMVVSKYINDKNEYNTRTMTWLPKTPIWNPSFETINATLNSENTKYWFYLHNSSTWKIYYAISNAEHEENKRLYMK